MRKKLYSKALDIINPQEGFTLIELLVTVTILVVLAGGAFYTLNPFGQIEKGEDAQKRQDLQQIKNALEAYYQDNNCYPEEIPFGDEWSVGDTVYMQKVPQDVSCNEINGSCYQYVTDRETADNCPQWYSLFGKLSQSGSFCPISAVDSTCIPTDIQNESESERGKWSCVLGGAVNCPLLAQLGFNYDSGTPESNQITPTPNGPLPTPTPIENSVPYTLGGTSGFNPWMKTMTIGPLCADEGTPQVFQLSAEDANADITDVKIHLYSDTKSKILDLSHSGGTLRNGTWSGTIGVDDTYHNVYAMAIVATDANGNDRCKVLNPGIALDAGSTAATCGGAHPEPDAICADINN